jgi:hypothetical protein
MNRRLVALAFVLVAGCSAERAADVAPEYDPASGRLTRLGYDSNRDGRPDMAASMDGGAVKAVEIDLDDDGLTDRWEFYEPAAGGAREPQLTRIEQVSRRGTAVVRREGFEAGELAWVHEDRDGDGRTDRWETYDGGALTLVELDTTGAGRPDRRLRYAGDQVRVEAVN